MLDKQIVLSLSEQQLLDRLGTHRGGLTDEEAARKRELAGPNSIETTRKSAWSIFVRQFRNAIMYLLLVAAAASFATGDAVDGSVVTALLLVSVGIGFAQEYGSERSLEQLFTLVRRHAVVRRSGRNTVIDHADVVPGDLVILRQGDIIPADMRLLETEDLMIDESALTGESIPVHKAVQPGSMDPEATLAYAGTVVTRGGGAGVVYATGKATEFGKIAHLSTSTQKVTEYGRSLETFSSLLLRTAFALVVPVFLIKSVLLGGSVNLAQNLIFMFAFAIAVAPEALPVVLTVSLANGAQKLARQQVVVRELRAIEDLGNITILCTDKTGTLTENKMTVVQVVAGDPRQLQVLAWASLDKPGKHDQYDNPYDLAIANYVSEELKAEAEAYQKVKELPFDPDARRRWVVLRHLADNSCYLIEIGAADTLLSESVSPGAEQYNREIAGDGVLGVRDLGLTCRPAAYCEGLDVRKRDEKPEFLGFLKMVDPLRPSTRPTIQHAQSLGVTVKILTGDSREVAGYVAQQIGLLKPGEHVYGGPEIERMTDDELQAVVSRGHIFARLTPMQKYRVIRALKESNVVGYQGDGINDAPSLKLADVSIAVDTATDVAREESDILLLRSELDVIISGIKTGRLIFANVNKYILYTMVGNFSAFLTLAALYLYGTGLPLTPVQVLVLSSFTQIPMVTMASDTVREDELARPSHASIHSLMLVSLVVGAFTAVFQLGYYFSLRGQAPQVAQTSLFLFLVCAQLIIVFSVRSKTHFWREVLPSVPLVLSMILTFLVILLMIYWEFLERVLHLVALPVPYLIGSFGLLMAYLLLADLVKVAFYRLSPFERAVRSARAAELRGQPGGDS